MDGDWSVQSFSSLVESEAFAEDAAVGFLDGPDNNVCGALVDGGVDGVHGSSPQASQGACSKGGEAVGAVGGFHGLLPFGLSAAGADSPFLKELSEGCLHESCLVMKVKLICHAVWGEEFKVYGEFEVGGGAVCGGGGGGCVGVG